jgi:hypothetical protein
VALTRLGQPGADGRIETLSRRQLFAARTTVQPGSEVVLARILDGLAAGDWPGAAVDPRFGEETADQVAGWRSRHSGIRVQNQ